MTLNTMHQSEINPLTRSERAPACVRHTGYKASFSAVSPGRPQGSVLVLDVSSLWRKHPTQPALSTQDAGACQERCSKLTGACFVPARPEQQQQWSCGAGETLPGVPQHASAWYPAHLLPRTQRTAPGCLERQLAANLAVARLAGGRVARVVCQTDQLGSTLGSQKPATSLGDPAAAAARASHSCHPLMPPNTPSSTAAAAVAGCCRLHGLCFLQGPCRLRDGLLSTCGQKPWRCACSLSVLACTFLFLLFLPPV